MRTPALAIVALLLLSGCGAKKTAPPSLDPNVYLVDAQGDATPRFDILSVNLTELHGSLAVRLQILNYNSTNGGPPFFQVDLRLSNGQAAYARTTFPPCTPEQRLPCGEAGRLEGDQRLGAYETCWFPSFPQNPESKAPWWLFIEVLHNKTGLSSGGLVERVDARTTDENGTVMDSAGLQRDFPVNGGPNPYESKSPSCPMHNERTSLV